MLRQSLKSPTPMPHELSPYPSPYASAFSSRLTRRRTIGTTKATVTTQPGGPVSLWCHQDTQLLFVAVTVYTVLHPLPTLSTGTCPHLTALKFCSTPHYYRNVFDIHILKYFHDRFL
eukprot:scpid75213/ scgid23676/ 